VVESIDEVGPKLQSEPLSEQEILMQTQVHIGEMRPSESSKLWSTISKRSDRWCGEVPIVGEPLDAARRPRNRRFRNCREPVAIRP
jgi:hypothetical protein